jgi:hypothetical protein
VRSSPTSSHPPCRDPLLSPHPITVCINQTPFANNAHISLRAHVPVHSTSFFLIPRSMQRNLYRNEECRNHQSRRPPRTPKWFRVSYDCLDSIINHFQHYGLHEPLYEAIFYVRAAIYEERLKCGTSFRASELPSFRSDQRLADGKTGIYSSQNSIRVCWSSKPTGLDIIIAYIQDIPICDSQKRKLFCFTLGLLLAHPFVKLRLLLK